MEAGEAVSLVLLEAMIVGLVTKSEARIAATHQFCMCSLSIWLAGCETGFTFAYEANVNRRWIREAMDALMSRETSSIGSTSTYASLSPYLL